MRGAEELPTGKDDQREGTQDHEIERAASPGWDDPWLSGDFSSDDDEPRFPYPTGVP
jgi:hypothetical protein